MQPSAAETSHTADKPAHQPLAGVRVVEIGTSVAAPYAAWVLGSLGAEVVKVERPDGGDDARQWGSLFDDGRSSLFTALNTNKLGITVNLKDAQQRDWLRQHCASEADVVLQNLRPGRIEAAGLGAVDLVAANSRLVYCNMGAFGHKGPLHAQAGYDPLMQAFGGLMSMTGEEGRPPVRVGVSIVDMTTGLWCAVGILGALLRREQTGSGCVIDASLYETALAWVTASVTSVQADGHNPQRQGSGARGMAPYQAYRCSDGYLVVAAPNNRLFTRLCEVLAHPEWAREKRFADNQRRFSHLAELNALLEPALLAHSRSHWQAVLDTAGIPNAPVQSILEMMGHAQTEALGIVQQLDADTPRTMGLPLSFDGVRPAVQRRAPDLGEHDEMIKGTGADTHANRRGSQS